MKQVFGMEFQALHNQFFMKTIYIDSPDGKVFACADTGRALRRNVGDYCA
jgi:hypothetical protein